MKENNIQIIQDPSRRNAYIRKLDGIRISSKDIPTHLTADAGVARIIKRILSLGDMMMMLAAFQLLIVILLTVGVFAAISEGAVSNATEITAIFLLNGAVIIYYFAAGSKLNRLNVSPSIVKYVCWVNMLVMVLALVSQAIAGENNPMLGVVPLIILILSVMCLGKIAVFARWFDSYAMGKPSIRAKTGKGKSVTKQLSSEKKNALNAVEQIPEDDGL